VTYTIDGEQYVTVLAGWGGGFPLFAGDFAAEAKVRNVSRVLTFKLGGSASLPALVPQELTLNPPPRVDDPDAIARGKQLYSNRCMVCHGDGAVGGGVTPDLRYLDAVKHQAWMGVVIGGMHQQRGMVSFAGVLSPQDAADIQAFVIERAHQLLESRSAP
jgi:mono/diheme cytochrome c family protein